MDAAIVSADKINPQAIFASSIVVYNIQFNQDGQKVPTRKVVAMVGTKSDVCVVS